MQFWKRRDVRSGNREPDTEIKCGQRQPFADGMIDADANRDQEGGIGIGDAAFGILDAGPYKSDTISKRRMSSPQHSYFALRFQHKPFHKVVGIR